MKQLEIVGLDEVSVLVQVFRLVRGVLPLSLLLAACADEARKPPDDTQRTFDDAQLTAQKCQPGRAASAYRASTGASGVAQTDQGSELVPCFQLTGMGSAENTLSITRDGSVFVAPVFTADGTGILRTRNHGESFDVLIPAQRGGRNHRRMQPYLFMDPSSERLLFWTSAAVELSPVGFDLSFSDDQGESFTGLSMGVGSADWIKLVAAPPVRSAPTGSDNVLYAIAPTPTSTPVPITGPVPLSQQVLRSVDGGNSWEQVGAMQLSLKPEDHGCPSSEWVIYGAGVALSDGSVYYGFRRCTRLGIAITRDEGLSWEVRDLPGSKLVAYNGILSHISSYNLMVTEPLTADSDDNLYALWVDERDVLRFSVSKDHAETWSTPLAVNAPGAPRAVFGSITAKQPGTVAIAYYGGDGSTYQAYMAESLDALATEPQFRSFDISRDAGPLFRGGFDIGYVSSTGAIATGDLVEIVQVKYAPNGDIWAAFVKDMCEGSSGCSWDTAAHAGSDYQGAIGRIVHR